MMKRLLLAAAMTCVFAAPSFAGTKCYTPEQAEAEQGIRIHSELMVIGLNCQTSRFSKSADNLYMTYRKFTAVHAKTFADYETVLLNYFKKSGSKNPESDLNTLRTAFANKISLDAAKMRPDMFCYTYAPRIDKVKGMDDKEIKQWAATSYQQRPVSVPLCK